MDALDQLLARGCEVLVVSKPHAECIVAICERFPAYKDKLIFRFTIGSASSTTLKFWEPGAPSFEERMEALRLAHAAGFQTSVSCEPMLDTRIEEVVRAVEPFTTGEIWIGVMNRPMQRLSLNGAPPEVKQRGRELKKACSLDMICCLYERLHHNPKIRWKDSVKRILGLDANGNYRDVRTCDREQS
jgi:DNA repair photolyase